MDRASIARVIALVLALFVHFGVDVPEGLAEDLVAVVVVVLSLWTAWKNNYIAKKGKAQKEVLEKHNLK